MNRKHLLAAFAIIAFASIFPFASNASAVVLGGQLFSTGGDVTVEVLPASAGYTSELHLFSPAYGFIALNNNVGYTTNIGSFPIGDELIFGIYVQNTGDTFYMGPGSRNPDGIEHAALDFLGGGVANVGFEDLFGGGDHDYDDNVFQFRGGIAPEPGNPIPEPTTMALIGTSFLGTLFGRKKLLAFK